MGLKGMTTTTISVNSEFMDDLRRFIKAFNDRANGNLTLGKMFQRSCGLGMEFMLDAKSKKEVKEMLESWYR